MFITYWFIIFICIFFPVFWLVPFHSFRKIWLLIACATFHYRFAGPAGVLPIVILGIFTYFAGLFNFKYFRIFVIALCVAALVFYKYMNFIILDMIGSFDAAYAKELFEKSKQSFLPLAPPLAISFFVFEFVHYLVDVQRGKTPLKSPIDFSLFSIFWPSVVSGPVKRFDQFISNIKTNIEIKLIDIQIGFMRIILGLCKKLLIADNLTAYINYAQPKFHHLSITHRWAILIAISLRILFDFSGYSDMAIGFARMMGIKLPENFNWPYLANSIQDFWRRWHISLSTWIRDYIYIPLGGNKSGKQRQILNALIAFSLCGLWHGAAWNFIFWGIYHGVGIMLSIQLSTRLAASPNGLMRNIMVSPKFTWFTTYLFVAIGWLYFFYPIKEATRMLLLLIGIKIHVT